jgi:hypothetical protein
MRRARCLALAVTLLAAPAVAHAGSYTGRGETGWDYDNKAYCCEDAVAAAQEDSARACEQAGGYPDFRRSSARGRCDWDVQRTRGAGSVYRCSATASVYCK